MKITQGGSPRDAVGFASLIATGPIDVELADGETVSIEYRRNRLVPLPDVPLLRITGAGRVAELSVGDGELGLQVDRVTSVGELRVETGTELFLTGHVRVSGVLTVDCADHTDGIFNLYGVKGSKACLHVARLRHQSDVFEAKPHIELEVADCRLRVDNLESTSVHARISSRGSLQIEQSLGSADLTIEGHGWFRAAGHIESSVTLLPATSPPRVRVLRGAEIRCVRGTGEFVCDRDSRVRGDSAVGFSPLTIICGQNVDLQYVNLYETDTACLKGLSKTRRVQPWWSGDGSFKKALKLSREAKPRRGGEASNALRWSMMRDIIFLRGTRGRDRALVSLLAFEARRMDAARRTKGLRDSAEALALYVARVFGYGCRVIKPLVVACLFSLALSATFVGLGGPTLTSIPTGDTAVTMVHPLKVVFALWFDLLALPLSSLRTSITDVAWTTQAMRSLGVQARVGVVAALLVNGGAYLAALAAAARYVRRRSGEFIIE